MEQQLHPDDDAPVLFRWLPRLLALVALALLPWSLWLSIWLPSDHLAAHWDAAWTGFDLALAAMLGLTAVGLFRRAIWLQGAAAAAATLLICDAWFDILTSRSDEALWVALGQAVLGELPLAAVCILVAIHSERRVESALHSLDRRGQRAMRDPDASDPAGAAPRTGP